MHEGPHDTMHWGCCWHPASGKGLWVIGVLSFLGGIFALWQGGEFWGVSYQTWYWTALVSGVLSAGARMRKSNACCMDKPEK